MDEAPEPKISLPESIVIGLLLGVLDLIDLVPGGGDLTDAPAALLFLYYKVKGISGTMFAIAWVLDLIPIIQEFPTRSLAWWISVYMDRHPSKVGKVIEQAGEAAQGAEGGLESEAAEGAVATEEAEKAAAGATAQTAETEAAAGVKTTEEAEAEMGAAKEKASRPEEESIEKEREKAPEGNEEEAGQTEEEKEFRETSRPEEGEGEEGGDKNKDEELEKELETEEERPYEEVLGEQLFKETPTTDDQDDEEEEAEEEAREKELEARKKATKVDGAQAKKAESVEAQLKKLKTPGEITAEADEDTFKDDFLGKAA
jgi:hypothetical protein